MKKTKLAVIALLIVSLGYSILGLNTRLLAQGFDSMTQVYVRIFFGFIISLLAFRKSLKLKKIFTMPKTDWFWLIMMGVVGYSIGIWLLTVASINSKLVNVAVIYATIPFVAYLYTFFLLKERLNKKILIFLLLAVYGIVTVSSKSFIPSFSQFGIGEIFAMLSVVTGAWWSVGRKMLSKHLNNKEITIMTMMIAVTSSIIIALVKGETLPLKSFTIPTVLIGIAIGSVLNFFLTFLENFSFGNISAVIGNQILMSSVAFSSILGFIFYHEVLSVAEISGIIMIFISVYWANKLIK